MSPTNGSEPGSPDAGDSRDVLPLAADTPGPAAPPSAGMHAAPRGMGVGPPPVGGGSGADAAATPPSAAAPAQPWSVDPEALVAAVLGVLRDPLHGLERQHQGGGPGLAQGLLIGGGVAIAAPVVRFLELTATGDGPGFAWLVRTCVGGILFLALAPLLGLLLRATVGKVSSVDWRDDVELLGSSLVFVLAGTLASTILGLLAARLGAAATVAGFVLGAFAHHAGLVSVGKLEPSRALWITAVLFAAAALVWA